MREGMASADLGSDLHVDTASWVPLQRPPIGIPGEDAARGAVTASRAAVSATAVAVHCNAPAVAGLSRTLKREEFSELSDAELVAACRAGDARAWEQLVRRYQRLIYSVPMRMGLSEDEAGDVFQQTCLRLFERLDTLRDPSRLGAWLVSTGRRYSLDALARRRAGQQVSDATLVYEPADDAPVPEESLALLEEQHGIRSAVAQLAPRCRHLLYHLFYDPAEPSYEQIAVALGMPTGSVGPVRARCFAKLKALLDHD